MTLYLIVFLGVVFHLIMKYRDAYTKSETFEWKRHLTFSGFSLLTAFVLVYFRDAIVKLLAIDVDWNSTEKMTQLLAFFLGYFADSIWKNVEKTGSSKLKVEEVPQAKGAGNDETVVQPENPSEPRPR